MGKAILNTKGYTLIEVLISVAILLIISVPISGLFVSSHLNNQDSRELETAMLLGQKILENKMTDADLVSAQVEDVVTNPPVLQTGDFAGYKVQTVITAVNHSIAVENDAASNPKNEPSVPVEVIEGTTGKRSTYKLLLDTGVDLATVGTAVKAIGSAVENYNYDEKNLVLRSATELEGMDRIFHLEESNIRLSTEAGGVNDGSGDITLTFDAVETPATSYTMRMTYGIQTVKEILSLAGITESNKRMKIAFVIENDSKIRRIKLANKPTFPLDIYVLRGLRDKTANTYYTGMGTGTDATTPLLSLNYGLGDSNLNDPKLASDLIKVHYNYKNKNDERVRESRLYEIKVKVFRTSDNESTATPLIELKTYRRAVL